MEGKNSESNSRVQSLWRSCLKFHGRPCQMLALGVRVCDTALRKLKLDSPDKNRLVCVSETDGCCVDAIQIGLHCTAGKKHLLFYKTGNLIFTVYDMTAGQAVRICTRPEIAKNLKNLRAGDILKLPEEALFCFEEAHPMTRRTELKVRFTCNAEGEKTPSRSPGIQDSMDQFHKFDFPK